MSELRMERAPATIPPATTVVMASTAIVSSKEAPLLMEVYSGVEPRSCAIGCSMLRRKIAFGQDSNVLMTFAFKLYV